MWLYHLVRPPPKSRTGDPKTEIYETLVTDAVQPLPMHVCYKSLSVHTKNKLLVQFVLFDSETYDEQSAAALLFLLPSS